MELKAIIPSIGRVVWYWPSQQDLAEGFVQERPNQPNAAIVCCVHTETSVNLSVMDSHGRHFARQLVYLMQPGQDRPEEGTEYCEWMPYQIEAAKRDALRG